MARHPPRTDCATPRGSPQVDKLYGRQMQGRNASYRWIDSYTVRRARACLLGARQSKQLPRLVLDILTNMGVGAAAQSGLNTPWG